MTTVNPKYKLGEKHPEKDLYRVVALRDFGDVKAGDIGGWVESENNLSHEGDCWVYADAQVYGDAWVCGDAQISGNARVYGNATVTMGARVFENARVHESAFLSVNSRVYGNARVEGRAQLSDNSQVFGNAWVHESARISGRACVHGGAEIKGFVRIFENACVFDDALVGDGALVHGNAHVFGKAKVKFAAYVYGSAQVCGDAVVGENIELTSGYIEGSLTIEDLLRYSVGIPAVDGVVRLYKRVNADMSSEYDENFIYPESGLVEADYVDEDPTISCGAGLHFSHMNYRTWIKTPEHKILAADIRVEDIICVQDAKVRCRKATIVGIVE